MAGVNPSHVFLDVSLACNLRCIQCGIHRLNDPEQTLTQAERLDVIRQLADWDPDIRLVLTGGELLLNRERLWDLADYCGRHGVYTTLSTNGTLVTEQDAARLAGSGIRCVVVSLDSHRPEVHDAIRGVPGTWSKAVDTVRRLVSARDSAANGFSVLTSTILGEHNLNDIGGLLDWLWSLGVDTTLFQPIQPDFAKPETLGWHAASPLWPKSLEAVNRGIDTLIRSAEAGCRVYQTPHKFEDMRSYFRAPTGLVESACSSLNANMMIDIVGQVRFCFLMDSLGIPVAGNVRDTRLRDLWQRRTAYTNRMRGCKRGCGVMICHAR